MINLSRMLSHQRIAYNYILHECIHLLDVMLSFAAVDII